jgi:hypothetical protein
MRRERITQLETGVASAGGEVMATATTSTGHELLTQARGMAEEICRELDPRLECSAKEALHITLHLGGHDRYIEMTAEHCATPEQARAWLRREMTAAVYALHQAVPLPAAPARAESEPVSQQPAAPAPVMHPADREALDKIIELSRHILPMIDPAAELSFEEYMWHGDPTLDITVLLHGREQHLEITATRARIILPDYEWELSRHNLQDELLYHELEEIVHDLHRGEQATQVRH